jgi:hypothetical protein
MVDVAVCIWVISKRHNIKIRRMVNLPHLASGGHSPDALMPIQTSPLGGLKQTRIAIRHIADDDDDLIMSI